MIDQECPVPTPTYIGGGDKGQGTIPRDYVAYRVTSEKKDLVFELFKGCCCVIAEEFSKEAVQHYHIVVAGLEMHDVVKKRLQRARLGVNKSWSKKNHQEDFLKAVSYTVKCGEYWTRKGFHQWVDIAPEWVHGQHACLPDGVKDTDKDWALTYNNVLRVAQNWRKAHNLKTDDLGAVLSHMTRQTRWTPSPQMLKSGLDRWHFKIFAWRCSDQMAEPPPWWEPRFD